MIEMKKKEITNESTHTNKQTIENLIENLLCLLNNIID